MRIIVSFDTEDFTDPAANDVLLQICRTLTQRGVRACFGLVGEKARFIRDLGRCDLVEALSAHEICYHSDNHFLFPDETHRPRFASEIVEECGWEEATRWLVATEARGLADLESLFGERPITYLRTCGDSAPQILEAYRQLGLKVYAYGPALYERTRHIAWYANSLCVSLPLIAEELTYAGRAPGDLDRVAAANEDLVNVRFHPCRFISDKWWSEINYLDNPDPPTRPPYRLAPRLPAEETRKRLDNLGQLVDYARQRHGVEFTTYGEVERETRRDPPFLTRAQVEAAARRVSERMSFADAAGVTMSLAESFAAVVWANLRPEAERVPLRRMVGPTALPKTGVGDPQGTVTGEQILSACRSAEETIAAEGRVPDEVSLAGRLVPPAVLLRAAAARLLGRSPIRLEPAPLYPEGFDEMLRKWEEASFDLVAFFPHRNRPVPNTKLAIKLQYWTYKPASL